MEETISLKDMLAVVVKQGKKILCFALIAAIIGGGLLLFRQVSEMRKPENSKEQLETNYQTAMSEYEQSKADLEERLADAKFKQERQKKYNDESILMTFDPYNLVVNTIILSVTGTDDLIQQSAYADKNVSPTYFLNKIQDYYRLYWNSSDLTKVLIDHNYSDVAEKYLREIISFSVSDSGTFTITVKSDDETDAILLGDAVYSYFKSLKSMVEKNTFHHQLVLVNQAVKVQVDDGLLSHQTSTTDTLTAQEAQVTQLEKEIKNLAVPTQAEPISKMNLLTQTLKGLLIGAIVGIILAAVVVVLFMFLNDSFVGSRQLEQVLKINFVGSLVENTSIWHRFADKLLNERSWPDLTKATAFIHENLKLATKDADSIAIISTLKADSKDPAFPSAVNALSPIYSNVHSIQNAEKNPDTITILQNCKYVVLAERAGVSKVTNVSALLEMAKRMGVTVVGFITI